MVVDYKDSGRPAWWDDVSEDIVDLLSPELLPADITTVAQYSRRVLAYLGHCVDALAWWIRNEEQLLSLIMVQGRDDASALALAATFKADLPHIRLDDSFIGQVARDARWQAAGARQEWPTDPAILDSLSSPTYCAVPLLYRGEGVGVLASFWKDPTCNPAFLKEWLVGLTQLIAEVGADLLGPMSHLHRDRFHALVRDRIIPRHQVKVLREHCGGEISTLVAMGLRRGRLSVFDAIAWEMLIDIGFGPDDALPELAQAKAAQARRDGGIPPNNPLWLNDFLPDIHSHIRDSVEKLQGLPLGGPPAAGGAPGTGRRTRTRFN